MAIVGESGAGKSLLVRALLGLLPPQPAVAGGQVLYGGGDLLTADARVMRSLRLKHIAATLTKAKS
jgi:ABC-type glutathione transport system ATPase component